MPNSVRPHRRKPTRLPCPWDSPGKSIGVGCHFLLPCVKVKSEREVAQSCPTLSDPTDCTLPGSSIHGIFQARVLEWGAIAFSNNRILLSNKGTNYLIHATTWMNLIDTVLNERGQAQKSYRVHDSIHMIFWKRQKFRVRN